jgi:hypothetical protein
LFPFAGIIARRQKSPAGAETAGPAAARGPAFGDGAGVDMVKRCFASQNRCGEARAGRPGVNLAGVIDVVFEADPT